MALAAGDFIGAAGGCTPRRSGAKLTPMIESDTGTITADPRPWSARPPMSMAGPVESAITSDARAYTAIP